MSLRLSVLSLERWAEFDFGRQIRMIASELHRASQLTRGDDRSRRRDSLDRVYALTDLTIEATTRPSRRRELLRWREMLGDSYLNDAPAAREDRALLRALLQLRPGAAPQVSQVST